MRVIESAPDRLVIEDRPVPLALGTALLILLMILAALDGARDRAEVEAALAGVAILGLAPIPAMERVRIGLDRGADRVRLEKVRVFGCTAVERPLGELERAAVESAPDEGGDLTLHRLALVFRAERMPVGRAFRAGAGPREAASVINGWIAGLRPSA